MPLAVIDPEATRATGRHWREVVDMAEPVDVASPKPLIPARCIRSVPAIRAEAVVTRDVGHVRAGLTPILGADRAIHLSLAFRDGLSERWAPHDHDAAALLCEGVFGPWLPFVLVKRHDPDRGREGRDAWHYRVFVSEDWARPLPDVRPEGHVPWLEHRAALDARRRRGA